MQSTDERPNNIRKHKHDDKFSLERFSDRKGESLIEVAARELAREKTETNENKKKRLAMNRVSARERRKRKHILTTSLQKSVVDLTRQNITLREMNEELRKQLEQLATALTKGLDAQRPSPFGVTQSVIPAVTPVQDLAERQIMLLLLQQQKQQQQRAITLANISGLGFAGSNNDPSSMIEGLIHHNCIA